MTPDKTKKCTGSTRHSKIDTSSLRKSWVSTHNLGTTCNQFQIYKYNPQWKITHASQTVCFDGPNTHLENSTLVHCCPAPSPSPPRPRMKQFSQPVQKETVPESELKKTEEPRPTGNSILASILGTEDSNSESEERIGVTWGVSRMHLPPLLVAFETFGFPMLVEQCRRTQYRLASLFIHSPLPPFKSLSACPLFHTPTFPPPPFCTPPSVYIVYIKLLP